MKAKPKKKNSFKKIVSKLHLWLGLTVGFFVLIISITGALYVFKDEFQNVIRKDYIHHNEQNISQKKILPLRILEQKVAAQTNEKYFTGWSTVTPQKPSTVALGVDFKF